MTMIQQWEIFHSDQLPDGSQPEAWGVLTSDYDPEDANDYATAVFFETLESAQAFADMGRAGASKVELNAFLKKHVSFRCLPPANTDAF
jgi:hypothetical protein